TEYYKNENSDKCSFQFDIYSIDNNWVYRRISQLVIIQRRVGRSCCFSVDAEKRMDYQKFTGQAGGAHHQ
ncbi:hypothetical protein, partial [Streptococcus gordonii]|uniref:hypothetical protein n=1 Tax=Streptococcus gordonii TaxID=1302 RepID=UPI001D06416C